jgi:hypothetical protein
MLKQKDERDDDSTKSHLAPAELIAFETTGQFLARDLRTGRSARDCRHRQGSMSAWLRITDSTRKSRHVRFVPNPEVTAPIQLHGRRARAATYRVLPELPDDGFPSVGFCGGFAFLPASCTLIVWLPTCGAGSFGFPFVAPVDVDWAISKLDPPATKAAAINTSRETFFICRSYCPGLYIGRV